MEHQHLGVHMYEITNCISESYHNKHGLLKPGTSNTLKLCFYNDRKLAINLIEMIDITSIRDGINTCGQTYTSLTIEGKAYLVGRESLERLQITLTDIHSSKKEDKFFNLILERALFNKRVLDTVNRILPSFSEEQRGALTRIVHKALKDKHQKSGFLLDGKIISFDESRQLTACPLPEEEKTPGSFSTIYRLGSKVIFKHAEGSAPYDECRACAVNEIQILKAFNNGGKTTGIQSALSPVYEVFPGDQKKEVVGYFAEEALGSLSETWNEQLPKDPFVVLTAIQQLLLGLKKTQEADIIHLDIYPDNILVHKNEDGTFRFELADFGAARHFQEIHPEINPFFDTRLWKYFSKEEREWIQNLINMRDKEKIKKGFFAMDIAMLGYAMQVWIENRVEFNLLEKLVSYMTQKITTMEDGIDELLEMTDYVHQKLSLFTNTKLGEDR